MSSALMLALEDAPAGSLRLRLFGRSVEETRFARRGFATTGPRTRERLESIGATCLRGYHAALVARGAEDLAQRLADVPLEERGFAYEGAAMGLALSARLFPWRRRVLAEFLAGPARPHVYMAHIGMGWAWAALPWPIMGALGRLDGFLRWLIVDGFGFYHAYFHARRYLQTPVVPRRVRGYARRAFDQGLGRGAWFVAGADPARVAATLAALPAERQGDLWAGVGLAASYACGVDDDALAALAEVGRAHRPQLAQGACFAALTRRTAGNPAAHTERACRALGELGADEAAGLADEALRDARGADDGERYEDCRRRIQRRFERQGG